MSDISNSCDTIDVRDVIERFETLEEEINDLQSDLEENPLDEDQETIKTKISEWNDENRAEFDLLKSLLDDLRGNGGDEQWRGDWYPITLIRDTYFVDAMQELVEDIGDLPKELPGYLAIDWEETANNLRVDYSSVEYDGITYWYR